LFISAYADGAIEAIGDLTPGVGFLQKPFAPDELLSKLMQILEPRTTD
jgi:hypothetical protein